MKVAFLCSYPSWGGLEMNIFRLALRMQERGNQVLLFAQQNTTIFSEAVQAKLPVRHLGIKHHYTDFNASRKLAIQLKKENIQVLFFSIAKDNYVAGWAKTFFYPQLHIIYLQQMTLGIPKKGFIQTFLYRKLSAWISPLQTLAEQVLLQTHMPASRIHVIPLGIDTKIFTDSLVTRKQARETLTLPQNVFIAGTIGRLDPSKGQDVLIKAVKLLQEKNIHIHALFVGKETYGDTRNYPSYLRQLIKDMKLEEVIHFREFTKEPELAFAALDTFVMSSHAEAYGMVTVEAMAAGLPIIGADNGGTSELLKNGNLGLLFETNNATALAEALEKIIKDEVLRNKIGADAKADAIQHYSYQVQCEQIENLLQKLTEKTRL